MPFAGAGAGGVCGAAETTITFVSPRNSRTTATRSALANMPVAPIAAGILQPMPPRPPADACAPVADGAAVGSFCRAGAALFGRSGGGCTAESGVVASRFLTPSCGARGDSFGDGRGGAGAALEDWSGAKGARAAVADVDGGAEAGADAAGASTRNAVWQPGQATRRPTSSGFLIVMRPRQLGQRTANGVNPAPSAGSGPDIPRPLPKPGSARDASCGGPGVTPHWCGV